MGAAAPAAGALRAQERVILIIFFGVSIKGLKILVKGRRRHVQAASGRCSASSWGSARAVCVCACESVCVCVHECVARVHVCVYNRRGYGQGSRSCMIRGMWGGRRPVGRVVKLLMHRWHGMPEARRVALARPAACKRKAKQRWPLRAMHPACPWATCVLAGYRAVSSRAPASHSHSFQFKKYLLPYF